MDIKQNEKDNQHCGNALLDAVLIEEGNKLIAEFMGYKYFESNVHNDGGMDNVYSKVPIEIITDDYGCKWFKELPNPDYKSKTPKKWNADFSLLSWESLNNGEYLQGVLEYHLSWDWLIPVVEKIEALSDKVVDKVYISINGKSCGMWTYFDVYDALRIEQNNISFKTNNVEKSKKVAVWLSVVEFIKWYNSNAPKV